jgi:hypothetical protein
MNKFLVFPCITQAKENYSGHVVSLACTQNIDFVLFFPIPEKSAELINYTLDTKPNDFDYSLNCLNILSTMIGTWKTSDRFLSGIYMDSEYDPEKKENIIILKLIISDMSGEIDAVVKIDFIYGILLAAMERKEIIISEDLLKKFTIVSSPSNSETNDNYDEDNNDEESLYNAEDNIDEGDNINTEDRRFLEEKHQQDMEAFRKRMIDMGYSKQEDKPVANKPIKNKKYPVDKNLLKIAKKILKKKK